MHRDAVGIFNHNNGFRQRSSLKQMKTNHKSNQIHTFDVPLGTGELVIGGCTVEEGVGVNVVTMILGVTVLVLVTAVVAV